MILGVTCILIIVVCFANDAYSASNYGDAHMLQKIPKPFGGLLFLGGGGCILISLTLKAIKNTIETKKQKEKEKNQNQFQNQYPNQFQNQNQNNNPQN
jgi:hypothetical protein